MSTTEATSARETVLTRISRFTVDLIRESHWASSDADYQKIYEKYYGPEYDDGSEVAYLDRAKSAPVWELLGPAHQALVGVIAESQDRAPVAEAAAWAAIRAVDPYLKPADRSEITIYGGLNSKQIAERTGFPLDKVQASLRNLDRFCVLHYEQCDDVYMIGFMLSRDGHEELWTPDKLWRTNIPELVETARNVYREELTRMSELTTFEMTEWLWNDREPAGKSKNIETFKWAASNFDLDKSTLKEIFPLPCPA